MLNFLLGMIVGAILIVAIAVVSGRNKKTLDRKTDYESGYEDGYAEGLNDARWKGVRVSKKKMLTAEPYQSIKPCPFCGWGTIVNGGLLNYRCQCNACGATTKGYPTWEMAMEAWNRRASDD